MKDRRNIENRIIKQIRKDVKVIINALLLAYNPHKINSIQPYMQIELRFLILLLFIFQTSNS